MADSLRLIDVNAGDLRLKKGQGILHLMFLFPNNPPWSLLGNAWKDPRNSRSLVEFSETRSFYIVTADRWACPQ